ncbi:MAG: hypothetical protein WCW77_04480 [Patescibacteria group bacterium]|jgi:hypothetical protein
MTKQLNVIITVVIVLALASVGYIIFKSKTAPSGFQKLTNLTPDNSTTGNKDGGYREAHGCIGSAGYTWCEAKQKCLRVFEEFCSDSVAALADSIKKESGVGLAYAGEKTFNWIVGQNSATANAEISGISYAVSGVKMADFSKIEKYLNDTCESDNNNQADGAEGGRRGYYIGHMACDLNFLHAQLKNNADAPSEPVGDNLNVSLNCGYFNKNNNSR